MNPTDYKYVSQLSNQLDKFRVKQNQPYKANFRCNVCGDSSKSTNKTRGWLIEHNDSAFYKCFNCGYSNNLGNYLQMMFPEFYRDYITDKIVDKTEGKAFLGSTESISEVSKSSENFIFLQEDVAKRGEVTKTIKVLSNLQIAANKAIKNIKKISSLPLDHPARNYVLKRAIPSNQHYRIYYAPKFNKWVNSIIPNKLSEKYDEPRLVMPFFDKRGNMFGFGGRSFNPKASLRYITIMVDNEEDKVFGLDKVNFDETYYIVEGQIDSMFLPNAVAMAGADGNTRSLKNIENAVFLFDNEPRNKEIVDRMSKIIDMGHKIVILSEKHRSYGKDINDMVLSGLSMQEILHTLTLHTYSGLEAKLALSIWKRV